LYVRKGYLAAPFYDSSAMASFQIKADLKNAENQDSEGPASARRGRAPVTQTRFAIAPSIMPTSVRAKVPSAS
jgi:hypothetical protein